MGEQIFCVASPALACLPASTSSRPCTSHGERPTPRSASRSLSLSPPHHLCAACPVAKQNINYFYIYRHHVQMKTLPPETLLHLNCISLIVVVHSGNIVQQHLNQSFVHGRVREAMSNKDKQKWTFQKN